MQQKVALTTAHLLSQGHVADMGMGSGTGSYSLAALYPALHVTGVDVSPEVVAIARGTSSGSPCRRSSARRPCCATGTSASSPNGPPTPSPDARDSDPSSTSLAREAGATGVKGRGPALPTLLQGKPALFAGGVEGGLAFGLISSAVIAKIASS